MKHTPTTRGARNGEIGHSFVPECFPSAKLCSILGMIPHTSAFFGDHVPWPRCVPNHFHSLRLRGKSFFGFGRSRLGWLGLEPSKHGPWPSVWDGLLDRLRQRTNQGRQVVVQKGEPVGHVFGLNHRLYLG